MQAASGASLTPVGDAHGATSDASTTAVGHRWFAVIVAIAAVAWAVDVGTKMLAIEQLAAHGTVEVVPGVLDLTLTRNPGAAFSLGTELTALLTVIALAVVVVVLRLALRVRSAVWALALGLLLGGALGNLTDRMLREPGPFRGHVVDFLRLPHWPVFNLADSWIVVAAALIALQAVRGVGLDGSRAVQVERRRDRR